MGLEQHTILTGGPWSVPVAAVDQADAERDLSATQDQRAALASMLDLTRLDHLTASVRVTALSRGRYEVTGVVRAALEQACVVTGDPVPAQLEEPINVILSPDLPTTGDAMEAQIALGPITDDEPLVEPLSGDTIELGRIVYETFAVAIEPFPRVEDAQLPDDVQASNRAAREISPFAVLADLAKNGNGVS